MLGGGKLRRVALQALSPLDMAQVGKNSVDVRLANHFWVPKPSDEVLDLSDPNSSLDDIYNYICHDELVLPNGGFVRGQMFEYVTMPEGVVGMFTLRSFQAQRGLQQAVSVYIRESWKGELILEISNDLPRPVKLKAGMWIGQLHFFEVNDGTKQMAVTAAPRDADRPLYCG